MRATRMAVTLLFFADGLMLGSWASRIPGVQAQAGLSNTSLGIALFASSVGALLAMPVAGWLCEWAGSRRVTSVALVVASASLVAAAAGTALPTVALGLFGFGVGFGAFNVAANAQGIALEGAYGRPVLSSFHAAFSIGGLAGAGAGAVIARAGVAPGAHLGAIAILLTITAATTQRRLLPPVVSDGAHRPVLARPPRVLLLLGAGAFCTLLAEGAAADWSATYLAQTLGVSAALAGLGYAAFSLAMATSRGLGDRLNRHFGPVRLARFGGLTAAAGLGAALLTGWAPLSVAGFGVMGVGLGVVVPILFRAAGSTPGVPSSVGVAAVSTIGWLGFLAGPPAIGFAAGAVGLRGALAIVVVAGLSLAVLAPHAQRGRGD